MLLDTGCVHCWFCRSSGPYRANGCPLRRVDQTYVIATKTHVDVSNVKVPEHVDDAYFRRQAKARKSKSEGEMFEEKTTVCTCYKVMILLKRVAPSHSETDLRLLYSVIKHCFSFIVMFLSYSPILVCFLSVCGFCTNIHLSCSGTGK